jgi:hypothetical protein
LILAIEFQNRIFLTIQLIKPFIIGHRAVLMGVFNFLYLQFSPSNLKWSLLFARSSDLGDPCGHVFITVSYFFRMFLYNFINICYIMFLLLCKNNNIRNVKQTVTK